MCPVSQLVNSESWNHIQEGYAIHHDRYILMDLETRVKCVFLAVIALN